MNKMKTVIALGCFLAASLAASATVQAVAAETNTVVTFAPLPDELRYQRTSSPVLPETLDATQLLVLNSSLLVPVSWNAENYTGPSSPAGLYVFIATPAEGYTLPAGAEAPRITVMLQRTSMLRMAGAGNDASPLIVTNAHQLAEIAALTNAGRLETFVTGSAWSASNQVYFQLAGNIDLSDYGKDFNGNK